MTAISSEWRAGIKKTPQLDEWKRQLAPPILIPSKLEQKYSNVTNKSAKAESESCLRNTSFTVQH